MNKNELINIIMDRLNQYPNQESHSFRNLKKQLNKLSKRGLNDLHLFILLKFGVNNKKGVK